MNSIQSLEAQIEAVLKLVCHKESKENGQWCEQVDLALRLVSDLKEEINNISDQDYSIHSLEEQAVSLWNFAVAWKTRGGLSLMSNAKLRHIAFEVIEVCSSEKTEETLQKKIMMGLKTGRAWIDAKDETMACKVLDRTDQMVKKLQKNVIDEINQSGQTQALLQKKLEIESDIFKLLCYKSEAALTQCRYQEALDMVLLAKEMLNNFPKESAFLSMLSYNFGVDLYQKKMYEESITWLRESFELGKGQAAVGPKNQARTLRLLASAYLEWDIQEHSQKALHAVSLANTEYMHPAGLYLKLRLLLEIEHSDEPIQRAVEDILRQPDITVDIGLNTVHLLTQYKRLEIATDLIGQLIKRYENTPDLGKLLTANFDILLEYPERKRVKEFVEKCITDHNTGKPLEPSIKKRFHISFWEEAAREFENKNYEESLEWYNYSLSLLSRSESGDKNLAKLHRNRASCFLSLNQVDKATEAIQEAEKYDRSSVHTQYMVYKLALLNSDVNRAKEALQKMCECATDVDENPVNCDAHGLICLAAQLALESKYEDTATLALECLSNCGSDHLQVLTALRCLIRLKLEALDRQHNLSIEKSGILHNLQTAYNKLLQLFGERKDLNQQLSVESNWFMKVAWNIALKCEDQPVAMKDFFSLCSQFTDLCPSDQVSLTRQKTCMMMAAAACLQSARTSLDQQQKVILQEEALKYIDFCKKFHHQLQEKNSSLSDSKTRDNTEVLLLMYEFEAKVKLKDPDVELLLERALKLPTPDPKAFETMAALAVEAPAYNKGVCVRALKVAIRKHLQMPVPDFTKCSKLFHSLVELALSGGMGAGGKEEAWSYYQEVLELINKRAQGEYPEIEILWLMTKAWNCGINLCSSGRYLDAEKWCSTSMKLLKHLGSMRESYEEHMTTTYGEVLSRIEKSKFRTKGLEEREM